MKNSLRKKYALTGMGMILAFLLFSLLLNSLLKEPFLIWENHQKMRKMNQKVERWMEEPSTDLQSKVEQLGFDEGVKISVFDENFQLLATTQPQLYEEEKSNFQIEKRLRELSSELDEKGEYFENQEKEKSGNLSYLIRAQKVEGQGYIVVRTSILSIQKNMMLTDTFYILSGILTLAVGSIIIIRFSKKMVKPLEDMNQVTQQIARLNFKEYVRVDSKDELGTLAASINSMSDQLRDAMGELQKELEFRKGMVRNLAHELKTPIAVIGGYAEHASYIAQNQPQKLPKYLEVISKESLRMNDMIQEILDLCTYENQKNTMQIRTFEADDFLGDLREEARDEFSREIQVENDLKDKISGDYQMLHRAVYNFLKNAVSHSPGDSVIRLKAKTEKEEIIFSVYNSKSHIPEEDLEKIWSAFYKTNKARTREQANCGIGLAIAREVALMHHGRVWVENKEVGVEFYLAINIKKI